MGGYLSAGVDSLLVALMTESSDRVIPIRSALLPGDETHDVPEPPGCSERPITRFSALRRILICCRRSVWHMDRPVGDALIMAFYKLAEGAARDLVIISGEGADEIFAGYSFQNVIPKRSKYHQAVPDFCMSAWPCRFCAAYQ